MKVHTKKKIIKVIVSIACVSAILVGLWSVGRVIAHDIPSMINGYEEIAIEYDEQDDWMGIPNTVATKTVKKKISFEDGIGGLLSNLMTGIVCVGFLIIFFKPEVLDKYYIDRENG